MSSNSGQIRIDSARLTAIVESSDDAIVSKDLAGIVTSWNAAAERVFGYSAAEMIGAPIRRLIPEDRMSEEDDILHAIARGERVPRFLTVRRRKDGGLIHVSVTVSPIRGLDGVVVGASKIARDITAEMRIQKALEISEVRYRRLFESAKDGILILDGDTGVVVDVNPFLVMLLGYPRESFIGRPVYELTFLGDLAAQKETFAELQDSEYVRQETVPVVASGGRTLDLEIVSSLYLVDGHRVVQCNIRDVSARRKAEDALREFHADLERRVAERTADLEAANRELEAFSYSVSHDLRAPLRTVDAFSQAVLEDYETVLPDEGRRYLRLIRGGAQKMGALIDDLLAFSRLSRTPLNRQKVNMNRAVQGALEDLGAARAERSIDLRIGELPACEGDAPLLQQVWVNLLSNAFKYTRHKDPAMVEVGCEDGGSGPTYFVRDNGTGFDMRYSGKLFAVFQRLHRAEDYEGTGVGLAIVQRVIHRHGGRVWAEAVPDHGATFRFTIEDEAAA